MIEHPVLEAVMQPWFFIPLALTLSAISLFLFRFIILHWLKKWTNSTHFIFDSLLVRSIAVPLTLCTVMVLFIILEQLLQFVEAPHTELIPFRGVKIILAVSSIIYFIDRFLFGAIGYYASKSAVVSNSQSIVRGITRAGVLSIGILVLLSSLGISITPILASLGITSLAVALALQPTLENFFSGVQLVVDKPIRVGDFIELESGEQGFVEKIGWRSTWLKMLPNNMIIIPNSQLSKSRIINYFYPNKELSVPVEVNVHYSSDLEFVEQVTLEVARKILIEHEWGVDDYNTFVIYHTFDNSSINFTVMLRAKEYFNRFWVKSAFIKALHKRYNEEGIVIPFPITAINTTQETAQFNNTQ
ncbi:mechanosensitive ion channel family protein [Pseudoalteromonas sp. MMG010]|uniref:mechanosensitive ion channel family protein n=1 Tax=Pseudoalteromonas sp. MMG010 TaxID=2822685 RepID=UPI001B3A2E32|nr:mechanosensitive ion channel family protein [Pseudoalteromonas sp. MMG010]MBQ4831672.1 mechanosensitive ion channel family protein [Pseudoalteromonas sp. MMG010]